MAEATITAPVARSARADVQVSVEDDAPPLVRLIGRTLSDAVERGHAPTWGPGSVAVRSHDTPQVATVISSRDAVEVVGGLRGEPDATLVVDLHQRFAPVQPPSGDAERGDALLRALRPPLPYWRDAAVRFWELTRCIPGIPDVLVVEAIEPEGRTHGRFGSGTSTYGIAGPADLLAGVFSGADDFLVSLAAGVQVQGTLSQLSVMTAASWKVRFDV